MEYSSYSESTFEKFIITNVCQNDKTLVRYLKENNRTAFRNRLAKFPQADKKIEKVVLSMFTEALRDVILSQVSILTKRMAPLGFLVVGGGMAINKYLPFEQKDIVSDIDTKFVPSVMGISPNSPKYFGYIQMAKVLMWYYLGLISQRMTHSKKIMNKIEKIKNTRIGKFLGISWKNPTFTRRYTLIPKFKRSQGTNVSQGNVLIDVEVMALDVQGVQYFSPRTGKVMNGPVGGVLDIAYMRRGEIGGKVLKSTTRGIGRHKNLYVAGKDFIMEDIYMMKSLKLRPDKIKKDRERLEKFAKYVYGVNLKKSNSNFNIYKKTLSNKKSSYITQRSRVSQQMIQNIQKLSPFRFKKYTTPPTKGQITRTSTMRNAGYRFNTQTLRWVKDRSKYYIKREKPTKIKLYGHNPSRDSWVPRKILLFSSFIPSVGFKEKN